MIGERLAEIRKDHGDNQDDLARKLNVSVFAIRSWEQEKSAPSHEMLVRVCRLYQVSSDYLLGLSNIDPVYEQRRRLYGDNVIEKHGINRDRTGDREKTRYLCGKQGIFTRDRALIRPGFIRQLETRASTRSASFFHALGSPGRPHNGGGAAGAYRTRNGAKPLKQGHLRAKRGPLGPSRKSQQQTKRTGFAALEDSIADEAPEGKRAKRANGALIRA